MIKKYFNNLSDTESDKHALSFFLTIAFITIVFVIGSITIDTVNNSQHIRDLEREVQILEKQVVKDKNTTVILVETIRNLEKIVIHNKSKQDQWNTNIDLTAANLSWVIEQKLKEFMEYTEDGE